MRINEIINNNLPILHAINLDGNNPGIISGKSDKDKKFLVHKKYELIWSGIFSHIFKRIQK